jgi:hypothetical protein
MKTISEEKPAKNLAKRKGQSGVLTRTVTLDSGKKYRKGTRVKCAAVWRGRLSVQVESTGAWIFGLTPTSFLPNVTDEPRSWLARRVRQQPA